MEDWKEEAVCSFRFVSMLVGGCEMRCKKQNTRWQDARTIRKKEGKNQSHDPSPISYHAVYIHIEYLSLPTQKAIIHR